MEKETKVISIKDKLLLRKDEIISLIIGILIGGIIVYLILPFFGPNNPGTRNGRPGNMNNQKIENREDSQMKNFEGGMGRRFNN